MKTLYKTLRNKSGAEIRKVHAELENKSGMKLSCYSTGDGVHFHPYLHDGIPESTDNVYIISDFLPVQSTGYSFTHIAKHFNLSVMSVMMTIQFLYKRGLIVADISRDGKIIGAHRNHS